jgi:hypothetical protein
LLPSRAPAEPLSKKAEIDFFRDVPSRNLKGLATRSDGRLVAGPVLTDLSAPPPAELLWTLEPTDDPAKFLLGTGADGRVVEVTLAADAGRATAPAKSASVSRAAEPPAPSSPGGTARPAATTTTATAGKVTPTPAPAPAAATTAATATTPATPPGASANANANPSPTPAASATPASDDTVPTAAPAFTFRDIVKLEDPQVFALKRLADGSLLAGTSPRGGLHLIRDEKPVARVALPVDSIFDLLVLDAQTALVATGNPGRIYKVDLPKLAAAGFAKEKITDPKILAERGVTLFGEIRDRNVRRLAALPDGRIIAGSAPKGNLYTFPKEGGAPVILHENRDAEVTDLLVQPNGDVFASFVFSSTSGESRITPPASAAKGGTAGAPKEEAPPPAAQVERFSGRSTLMLFPADGFPETLASRASMAFYRIVRQGDVLLVAGGEQGEIVGYDLKARLALTFAGSISSQLNGLVPLAGAPGRYLVLRNNAPGLAVLDFAAGGAREAETRRIDLGTPATLGALRVNRLRGLAESAIAPEIKLSNGSDDVEGWTAWAPLKLGPDGGWRAESPLRGRHIRLRLRLPDAPATSAGTLPARPAFEIDRATLFALPQNRRPQLQDFRVLTPNYGVLPAPDPAPQASVSLSQLMSGPKDDDRRKTNFLSSNVVPSPGSQVVLWTVSDPDNDTLACTFSIRREGEENWTDVVTDTRDSFAQFDTKHLADGVYFTRLVATEMAPRPKAERLTQTFETDDLVVDHTPPEMLEATAARRGDAVVITVRGRDRLSLLDGIEVIFSNNVREVVEQPDDGVRDGREEAFTLDVPLARISNATSVEVTLYDAAGNGITKRLSW